jgi:anaerobic ribonucleoside-triphosphate reductase
MICNLQDLPLRCPCCGFKTLGERGGYEICAVCGWEDDGQDEDTASQVFGGPNGELSLTQARANYRQFGASHRERLARVRPPRADEM